MFQVFRTVNDPEFTACNCALPQKFWSKREAERSMWENVEHNELEHIEIGGYYRDNGKNVVCVLSFAGKTKRGDTVYYEIREVRI